MLCSYNHTDVVMPASLSKFFQKWVMSAVVHAVIKDNEAPRIDAGRVFLVKLGNVCLFPHYLCDDSWPPPGKDLPSRKVLLPKPVKCSGAEHFTVAKVGPHAPAQVATRPGLTLATDSVSNNKISFIGNAFAKRFRLQLSVSGFDFHSLKRRRGRSQRSSFLL